MKNAIIVGATSGIGLEVARIMRSEGVNIGVAGRREDRLRKFAEEGGNVVWQRIDVTDENAGGLLVDLAERMGGVDTILLVSGIGNQNRDLDPGIEIATAETNVVGFTRMIDAAFNYLKSHGGGHIGAVSSIAGTKGLGIAPAYSATKRFQNTYIQCLAQLSAMTRANITFTDIRPGFIDTAMAKGEGLFWVTPVDKAVKQIKKAISDRKKVAFISKRWKYVAWLFKLIPSALYCKM